MDSTRDKTEANSENARQEKNNMSKVIRTYVFKCNTFLGVVETVCWTLNGQKENIQNIT